jgi:hypothetical protein
MTAPRVLADDSADLLQHLLIDRLAKAAIAVVALLVLAIGMAIIWIRHR